MRRLTTLLLSAALLVTLAGCGDDTESGRDADEPTTAAASSGDIDDFAKALSTSSKGAVSTSDARCVGEHALPDLSAKGKKALASVDAEGPGALSDDDQEVLFAAFDDCITTASLAEAVVEEMSAGADDAFGPSTLDCVTDRLIGDYPNSGDLMRAVLSDDGEAVLGETMTACISPDDMAGQLVDEFTSQGFTEDQAQCIASAVTAAIPADELIELGQSDDDLPAEAQQIITDATTSCLGQG